jgi:hypothetical protein
MTDENIKPYMAISPTKKMGLFQRREEYPILPTPTGDQILIPIRDYRKFRGDASYWQALFLLVIVAFVGFAYVVLMRPPVTVEKPLIVEKEIVKPVPTRCLVFCK